MEYIYTYKKRSEIVIIIYHKRSPIYLYLSIKH